MVCKEHFEQTSATSCFNSLCLRWPTMVLLFILLLAAFLRLVKQGQSPPGLNQDEAVEAWNAYCLLKTGKDQVGVSWPIFYMRGLGCNYPTLFVYLLMPFQLIGGMNIFTTRLPAAVGGIFTVWLIYFVGRRLFGEKTGLLAAFFTALNPWHLQQSRWGHEASICPLLGLVPLAMLLWAGIPADNDESHPPKPLRAAIAGAVTAISCYGYLAIRLFVPIFLLLFVLFTLPEWRRSLKSRKGVLAVIMFFVAFALVFGPLVWQHIFYPEGIGRHIQYKQQWFGTESFSAAIKSITDRYAQHFGFDFLFIRGDPCIYQTPPNNGLFHWYMPVIMILGWMILFRDFSSRSARMLFAFVLSYPVGDCFGWELTIHALRSSPGLCSLVLLASVGAVETGMWLWHKSRIIFITAAIAFFAAVVGLNARYFYNFYYKFNRRTEIYLAYNADLVEACRWLKPRLDEFDAVFCTTQGLNMPYIVTLVVMDYDPKRWFKEGFDVTEEGEWDNYTRYGKMYFMYNQSVLSALKKLSRNTRVLFIVRPGELGLKNPIHQIYCPDGTATLWICQP